MLFCSIVFLLLLTVPNNLAQNVGSYCVTPNGEPAICRRLQTCALLANTLSSRDITQQIFLQNSICGVRGSFYNKSPLVCCGSRSTYKYQYLIESNKPALKSIPNINKRPTKFQRLLNNKKTEKTFLFEWSDKEVNKKTDNDQHVSSKPHNVTWLSLILNELAKNGNNIQLNSSNSMFSIKKVQRVKMPVITSTKKLNKNNRTVLIDLRKVMPKAGECGLSEISERIVGGTKASLGEFPWMALLGYHNGLFIVPGFFCGGALISKRYVLTAAHCVVGDIQKGIGQAYYVRLGEFDQRADIDCVQDQGCNNKVVDVGIEKITVLAGFHQPNNTKNRHHDIALIRLNKSIEFTDFINPICLPLNGESAKAGDVVFSAGWGATDKNSTKVSSVKLKVDLKIVDQGWCTNMYRNRSRLNLWSSQICAGGIGGKDTCSGDSGGPLMKIIPRTHYWYIEGIVSYGPSPCAQAGLPGIYTKVSDYLQWIRDNIEL